MSNVTAKHPLYGDYLPDWTILRDFSKGERYVKEQTTKYLPATAGMILDGMGRDTQSVGAITYRAYVTRAVFHDFVSDAVLSMIGIMHSKPPKIDLPEEMKPLLDKATPDGLSLAALLRKINMEQILTGRVGLMADLPEDPKIDGNPLPFLVTYNAETITNWDDGGFDPNYQKLNLVVLDESGPVRDADFTWTTKQKFRVLKLDGNFVDQFGQQKPEGTYLQGVFDSEGATEQGFLAPVIMGKTAPRIPFVVINACDVHTNPDTPPLLALANICWALYRGEADYRQNLFMQGQDTLVVVGGVRDADPSKPVRTGAGARIDVDITGDAKYIGVQSTGLSEQSKCIDADKNSAIDRSMQLLNPRRTQRESGEALHTRVAARTVTLHMLANSGAEGLQGILRTIAEWKGLDPKSVNVTPNLDFTDDSLSSKEFVELLTARSQGAPISYKSIHNLMVERGLTNMDYEEELALVKKEGIIALPGANPGGDPTGSGRVAGQQSANSPSPGATT
jgi:hypothetical protein